MTGISPASIPSAMRALILDGVGFEHLHVRTIPVPRPGPRQVLARVDAAGICTSLIKLVEQGPQHKQVYDWDIARFPLVLGDEGSVTLVEIGQNLRDRFHVGERYVIQPAVDHAPVNHRERYPDNGRGVQKVAVGYTLPGHLAEYVLVTEETIEAECLLPVPDATFPFAHSAMSEPFSCVISAQDHHLHLGRDSPLSAREVHKGLKRGGVTVIIGAGSMGRMHVDSALRYGPRAIIVAELLQERLDLVHALFGARAAHQWTHLVTVNPVHTRVADVVRELTGAAGADDVIVAVGSREAIEESQHLCGRGAVLNLFGGLKKGQDVVNLDTGIVHYKETNVTGSSGGSPWDMQQTLALMCGGKIDAGAHITRIGDLEHAPEFLSMIIAHEIDGKAIVYPHRRTSVILKVPCWTVEDERAFLGHQAAGSAT
jgi:threonine dehydrogenase-like Zn-dependent dehydrogenase